MSDLVEAAKASNVRPDVVTILVWLPEAKYANLRRLRPEPPQEPRRT